ncbi:MAG: hypothetical protein GX806_05115, partial [Lentisphaerae bacterium]|nr:hypothetical protein [Lentisphaerota bacterium]
MYRQRHIPLAALLTLLLVLIAGGAGLNFWLLVKLYERSARAAATAAVLQYGTLLTKHLAAQAFLQQPEPAPEP